MIKHFRDWLPITRHVSAVAVDNRCTSAHDPSMSGDRPDLNRAALAALLAAPPATDRQRAAVRLVHDYRRGLLLDYAIVRQAVRRTPTGVTMDWRLLARFADDMAGARGAGLQRAAYQSGASRTAVRYVLAAAAGIALGEITPTEASALAAAFTAVAEGGHPSRAEGGES